MVLPAFQALVQDGSPFALGQAMVAGRAQTVFRHGPASLPDIYRKSSRSPDRPILIADDAVLTLHGLYRKAGAYARLFAEHGIGPGARVALMLTDDADWMAAFIALTSLGITAVLTSDDAPIHQAQSADCGILVTDRMLSAASQAKIIHARDAEDILDPPALVFPNLDPEQEVCIAFTSGSSGDPKGAILTHRGVATGLMNMMLAGAHAARSAPDAPARTGWVSPSALLRTPLHHVSGYMQMLLMFMTGGRIVRSRRTDICPLIAEHKITSIVGISDEEIAVLLDAGTVEALRPLRSVVVAGRSLPPALRRAVRRALPDLGLGTGYGLTETNGLVCAIGNADLDRRPQSVGPLLPTVECRIARKDGQDCAPGERGAIHLRGAMLMRDYCQRREPGDGWFATGDAGYLSDDGHLHVLDKEDRLLHGSGICCREIEDAARAATGLSDIAVLPLRDGSQESVMIVTAAQAGDLSRLRDVLAQQFPAEIIGNARLVSTDRLPRTASGKIAYAQLMEEAMP